MLLLACHEHIFFFSIGFFYFPSFLMAIVYMNTWQHTGQIHAISLSWTRFFLFVLLQLLLIHRFRLSIVLINDYIPSYFHISSYINKYTIHEHLADRRCDWAWKLQNWHDLKIFLIKTYKNVFWQWAIIRFMDEWSIWLGRITIYNCKSQCLLAAHWSDSWTRFFSFQFVKLLLSSLS